MFYVILDGEVEVLTPSPVELTDTQVSPEGILSFFVNFDDRIFWQQFERGSWHKERFYSSLVDLRIKVGPTGIVDRKECISVLEMAIRNGMTDLHRELYKLVNPHDRQFIKIQRYLTVKTLGVGRAFGELALLSN